MPEVVVIDEIGTMNESMAARTISQRGVQLIATAHGHKLENVLKNPSLVDLLGGIETYTFPPSSFLSWAAVEYLGIFVVAFTVHMLHRHHP